MPAAARVSDPHVCPVVDPGPKPHAGGPVLPSGCPTVLFENHPAARVGDMASCAGPPDAIIMGCSSVLIGDKPAARVGDATAHGGLITAGAATILIGETAQALVLRNAAVTGAPFAERCPFAK